MTLPELKIVWRVLLESKHEDLTLALEAMRLINREIKLETLDPVKGIHNDEGTLDGNVGSSKVNRT